ncbi:polysaccharide deacetylase family protein, partial [Longimicrobium sp.]|uniref:polysaccharide deacetylase family protein n=1 Tax=Longimicrobium sp. TaxID=2029185 RepID=UPI002E349084
DVEDVRSRVPGGARHPPRVPALTGRLLDFLGRHGARATFFVVGDVARAHPELIRRIAGEGHEIGCHSDTHAALDRQTPAAFRDDLARNLEALRAAGVDGVRGYRAPYFSLTADTAWAYGVLAELGFTYSSSVLPSRSPLHGWPGFGRTPRAVDGVLEMPVTLLPAPLPPLPPVPNGGGVYFRVLPWPLLRRSLRADARAGRPVLGYLHPYDVDTAPQPFAHPGFARWSPGNWLMHANRGAVLERLERVARMGFAFQPYGDHARAPGRAPA